MIASYKCFRLKITTVLQWFGALCIVQILVHSYDNIDSTFEETKQQGDNKIFNGPPKNFPHLLTTLNAQLIAAATACALKSQYPTGYCVCRPVEAP